MIFKLFVSNLIKKYVKINIIVIAAFVIFYIPLASPSTMAIIEEITIILRLTESVNQ